MLTELKKLIIDKTKELEIINFHFFYNAGVEAYDKKNYEKALEKFKLAVKQEKIKPQVYYNLALCYQNLKNYDNAIVNYNKFLEANPEDGDGLYNLALTYYAKENYPKAIEFFEKIIVIKKEEDSIKALIRAYLKNNEVQKAIDFANNTFETFKNGIDLYFKIAKIFESKNSHNKNLLYIDIAIEMYSKIIEKDSKNFNAYLAKSICYAKKADLENSIKFCEMAFDINPKSYEVNMQMGVLYYCNNQIEESIKCYEEALKLNPDGEFKIYSSLGYAYEKIGDYKKAIKIFNKLLDKFPKCPAKEEIKNHMRILKEKY